MKKSKISILLMKFKFNLAIRPEMIIQRLWRGDLIHYIDPYIALVVKQYYYNQDWLFLECLLGNNPSAKRQRCEWLAGFISWLSKKKKLAIIAREKLKQILWLICNNLHN